MPAEWVGFIGAIIGGLIGGLFTFLGVKLTIRHEKQKAIEEERKKAWERKPILRVKSENKGLFDGARDGNSSCDVLILEILDVDANGPLSCEYDPRALNLQNLAYVEYELENVGYTGVSDICLVSDQPFAFAFCPLRYGESLMRNKEYRLSVTVRKTFLLPGERIRMRFYYLQKNIPTPLPKIMAFVLDSNGNYWKQELWPASGDLMDPKFSSFEELKRYTDINAVIDGFRNPSHQ